MIQQITLQAARINAMLSMKEAAMKIGITTQTLSAYERGVQIPKVDTIDKIIDLYGISYSDINWRPGARKKEQQLGEKRKLKYTLKELRKNTGLTQMQAAKMIGLSLSTLECYEKGFRLPGVDMIEKILKFYGVKYEDVQWIERK